MHVRLLHKLIYIMSYKFYYGNLPLSKLFLPRNNWSGAKYILHILNSIKKEGERFEILLGGARYWAVRKLKYETVPCVIISDTKISNYKRIRNYEELLKIAKVKKLWYLNKKLYYEG